MNIPDGTLALEIECLKAFKLSAYHPTGDEPDFDAFIAAFRVGPMWKLPTDDPRYLVLIEQWLAGRGFVVEIAITCGWPYFPLVWLDLTLARYFCRHLSLNELLRSKS